jgi:selenocysteine lyase/cysteine desulfurase
MTPSAPDFRALRARFPTLSERAYFATHCLGPVSIETLADLDEYRRTLGLRNRALEPWLERVAEIRGLFAQLIGADPDEIALGPNATACQGVLATALQPTPNRDTIVVADLDFPSTRYLWEAQARRGFRIRSVGSPDGIALPAEALVAAIDARVAIVAVPLVAYTNGALLRIAPVIAAARAAGARVVVDAYQAAGIVPIDVRALDVDALVAGTHKWLGAPGTGLAFLYVRRAWAESLEPATPGWFAHASTLDFDRRFTPAPGTRRFEQGSPAIEPVYTARAGVRFAIEVGVAAMRARSLELTDRLVAGADRLGIPLRTPRDHAERAGVVCLGIAEPERVAAALRDRGIDADTRPGTGIRLSAHPCNTEEDCDRVLAALAAR